MEQLKDLINILDMNETDAMLNTLLQNLSPDDEDGEDVRVASPEPPTHEIVSAVQCSDCNDGERAILAGYVSLMRQCIELAEKVEAAKA